MYQLANDFKEECDSLYLLLQELDDDTFLCKTQFKNWNISNVIGHLHMWNWAAFQSLTNEEVFRNFFKKLAQKLQNSDFKTVETEWLDGRRNKSLLHEWYAFSLELSNRYSSEDPKKRVPWAGPEMSVRSSATARLMETWAHGQEVYDLLGVERVVTDRIKHIAVLGVNTFGWAFRVNKFEVPDEQPYVSLAAPSGAAWSWGDPLAGSCVKGSAVEFCQVVTQVRNISDTSLEITGNSAKKWMDLAQCFAGPPSRPPSPGTRYIQNKT